MYENRADEAAFYSSWASLSWLEVLKRNELCSMPPHPPAREPCPRRTFSLWGRTNLPPQLVRVDGSCNVESASFVSNSESGGGQVSNERRHQDCLLNPANLTFIRYNHPAVIASSG